MRTSEILLQKRITSIVLLRIAIVLKNETSDNIPASF